MTSEDDLIDPRAPRFGQAVTATVLLTGLAFRLPAAVYAVAAVLLAAVLSGWRLDLYGVAWRGLRQVVDPPAEREPASPHRFAKLVGAAGTATASGLLLGGLPVAGYAVAAVVAGAAGLAATTGICIGCRCYRQVGAAQRLGVV